MWAEDLALGRPEVLARLASTQAALVARGVSPGAAREAAIRSLGGGVALQGTVIAFDRLFITGALLFVGVLPLVLLLRAPKAPPASSSGAPHKADPKEHVHVEIEV